LFSFSDFNYDMGGIVDLVVAALHDIGCRLVVPILVVESFYCREVIPEKIRAKAGFIEQLEEAGLTRPHDALQLSAADIVVTHELDRTDVGPFLFELRCRKRGDRAGPKRQRE